MWTEAWSSLLSVYGLIFQALQQLCGEPAQISAGSLNTAEYFGTWYFIAAAGEKPSDLQNFTLMDNTIFNLQGEDLPQRLLLRGAIRVGEHCLQKSWTYLIHTGRDDMELEGRPDRTTNIFQVGCKDCIGLQEITNGGNRIMLYARNATLAAEQVQMFQFKVACMGMNEFLILPQEREYCQFMDAP
ncbi:apolipoprotein M [Amia ocellicauda]|uniref:apolipoprotein M n=1 Tax=Amia ocellicauda TaxID=2972642 RepID=UPI003463ABC3